MILFTEKMAEGEEIRDYPLKVTTPPQKKPHPVDPAAVLEKEEKMMTELNIKDKSVLIEKLDNPGKTCCPIMGIKLWTWKREELCPLELKNSQMCFCIFLAPSFDFCSKIHVHLGN